MQGADDFIFYLDLPREQLGPKARRGLGLDRGKIPHNSRPARGTGDQGPRTDPSPRCPLRTDPDAVAFVRSFFDQRKPVAVICHGPWTLVEADVLRGRTLTSWPSLQTDLRNAGATWVDEEVHVDDGLVSSRKPDDLPAFCERTIEQFAAARSS